MKLLYLLSVLGVLAISEYRVPNVSDYIIQHIAPLRALDAELTSLSK